MLPDDAILVMSVTGIIVALFLHNAFKNDAKVPLHQFIALAVGVSVVVGGFTGQILPYREYADTAIVFALVVLFGVEILIFSFLRAITGSRRSGAKISKARPNTASSVPAPSGVGTNVSLPRFPQPHRSYSTDQTLGKPRIFISYRRSDSQDVAGRIYDGLVSALGLQCVFKDVDTIRPGEDFRAAINAFLSQCDVVLVLIGTTWIDARDANGARRLDDRGDFVRIEIETALSRNATVIPVLVQHAKMPPKRKLPRSMHQLLFNNAVVVRPDPDFHRDMDRLINALLATVR